MIKYIKTTLSFLMSGEEIGGCVAVLGIGTTHHSP